MTLPGDVPLSLFGEEFAVAPGVRAALDRAAEAGTEERGAVFTKAGVVDFILDLAGYTCAWPLHNLRLLEPSAGAGDFLIPAVRRLIGAYRRAGGVPDSAVEILKDAVRAVEVHRATFESLRDRLQGLLADEGLPEPDQSALLDGWLLNGDFLLAPLAENFDFVIGNPPYIRQEMIAEALLGEYRRRYSTLFDRADIYVPFIERSLRLLGPGGNLTFICADRWMKNRYGGPLRRLISREYHLKYHVDMVDASAFHSDVTAYPAVFSVVRGRGDVTRVARVASADTRALQEVSGSLLGTGAVAAGVRELTGVARGDAPWVFESSQAIDLVRRLESAFPTLEAAGCRVGIGVATGADKVFIGPFDRLDVEPGRKLPLVMTRDITDGTVRWRGFGVINPFADDGTLVPLEDYPRLRARLESRVSAVKGRHVARGKPHAWYRTIDRITPSLATTPKLLIPDIKGSAHVVYENGVLYPHHNLYYVTAAEWDLRALQAVLLSGVARLFIAAYSTRMRGGFLRFQAQSLRVALAEAAHRGDVGACNRAAAEVYGLSAAEREFISPEGD